MIRTALRGLLAHKIRLLASALAVTIGVSFMAGTLVLSDTIQRTFDGLFASVYHGTDAVVRSSSTIDPGNGGDPERAEVPDSLVETVRATPEVAAAAGMTQGYAQLIGHDGKAVGDPNQGAPTIGLTWDDNPALNPFHVAEGRAPRRGGEVVIDRQSATQQHFAVGQDIDILTNAGRVTERIVGIAKFGQQDSLLGASVALFDPATAARLMGHPGQVSAIRIEAKPGVSQQQVVDAVARRLPPHTQAITGAAATKESQDQIQQGISFFTVFLLVFAVIALFVGSFIIYNTFSIVVAQRTRELALLRAVGASRRQVLGAVLGEATVVGLLSAAFGLGLGVLFALGLKSLLSALGFGIPATGIVIQPRAVIVALVAGLGVTLAVAAAPARRASRVAPIAALAATGVDRSGRSTIRVAVGFAVLGLGVASLFGGLFGHISNGIALVGLGAALTFLGVSVLGPIIAAPLSRLIGWPVVATRGVVGRLARENAMRNPRRTASTAAALMIGVGLMAFFSIFAASAKASVSHTIDTQFHGDFFVDSGQRSTNGSGFSQAQVAQMHDVPGIVATLAVQLGVGDLDGKGIQLPGMDVATLPRLGEIGVRQGQLADLGAQQLAVSEKYAKANHLHLGSIVPLRVPDRQVATPLEVAVIYRDADLVGDAFLSTAGFDAHFSQHPVKQVYLLATRQNHSRIQARLNQIVDSYPTAKVENVAQFKADQTGGITSLLGLIDVLLLLAVVIALLGIVNTLALSILERTQELGLMRAVGMSRRQTRSIIRWESVITSLVGTGLGLVIGLFFGWSVVHALSSQGINQFAVPVGQTVLVVVVAALAGVAAAVLPARRAARLDVLAAVAAD
jgi:putative ABC transport system permease protein